VLVGAAGWVDVSVEVSALPQAVIRMEKIKTPNRIFRVFTASKLLEIRLSRSRILYLRKKYKRPRMMVCLII
jgi:hypothetical protein